MPDADLAKFASRAWINPPGGAEGSTLASAATITLSHPVHKLTGAVSCTTINPPFTGFVGHVTLVPTGAAPFATGGNIAAAFTATANVPIIGYYDGSLWYLK